MKIGMKRVYMIFLILLIAYIISPGLSVRASWRGVGITIKADGSVEPSDAPLRREGNTYFLMDDIEITTGNYGIVIERDGIIIDGVGHTLKGRNINPFIPDDFFNGICLNRRQGVIIKRMILCQNFDIVLRDSSNNSIIENFILDCATGIYLYNSSNNLILNNILDGRALGHAQWAGIWFTLSNNNKVIGNRFLGYGIFLDISYKNVIVNNTVDDKLLIYLEEESDKKISNMNVGQIILVNCNNITIEDFNISNTNVAIMLLGTRNSVIRNNRIEKNWIGIRLSKSQGNRITNNDIKWNTEDGIRIGESSSNEIIKNDIENNYCAINLLQSSGNKVIENDIKNNYYGIRLFFSPDNTIERNHLENNNIDISSSTPESKTITKTITIIIIILLIIIIASAILMAKRKSRRST